MPLYAAGDLPAGRLSRAAAAHVAACASCAALLEEFRASREWMREADAVPEFGEEFYERLRAGVLDRVNRDTRPAAPSRLVPFFAAPFAGRRLAYAASLALAACALALAFYFSRDGGPQQQNDIVVVPPAGELVNPPQRAYASPTPGAEADERQPSRGASRDDRLPARPKGATAAGSFKRTPTLRRAAPTNDDAPPRVLTAESNNPARQVIAPPAPRAETASVSRIEIQTADPSIRIIWLTPGAGGDDKAEPDGADPDR